MWENVHLMPLFVVGLIWAINEHEKFGIGESREVEQLQY